MIWLSYVKDELYVNLHNSNQMRPLHALDDRGAEFAHLWGSRETWQGYVAVATDALRLVGPDDRRILTPPLHDQFLAIAGRRDSRYLAVHARSAVLTWDLGDVLPEPVARDVIHAWVFDDGAAVVSDFVHCEWLDLTSRARTPIALPPGVVTWERADPATGRQLLVVQPPGEPPVAVLAHRGRSEVTPVDLPGLHRIDFSGSDLIAGTTAGEIVLIGNGAAPRVVHRLAVTSHSRSGERRGGFRPPRAADILRATRRSPWNASKRATSIRSC